MCTFINFIMCGTLENSFTNTVYGSVTCINVHVQTIAASAALRLQMVFGVPAMALHNHHFEPFEESTNSKPQEIIDCLHFVFCQCFFIPGLGTG